MAKEQGPDLGAVREYERGYHDGLESERFDDGSDAFTTLVTLGFAGGGREHSGEYARGYEDGKEDAK